MRLHQPRRAVAQRAALDDDRRTPRLEALVSGPVVVALFAWLALTACFGGGGGSGPGPQDGGNYQTYNGIRVSDTTIGGFNCDGQGNYRGGGSEGEDQRIKSTFDNRHEAAKKHREELDRAVARCGGKAKGQASYDAENGCNRADLKRYEKRRQQLIDIDANLRSEEERLERTIEDARAGLVDMPIETGFPSEKEYDAQLQRVRGNIPDMRKRLRALEGEILAVGAKIDALDKEFAQVSAACERAKQAAVSDPCSTRNYEGLKADRDAAAAQERAHKANADRFDRCLDDRRRQAQSQIPAGRTTVDPSIIQVLPGVMGGFGHSGRHGGRSSGGSSGSHKD